MKKKEVKKDSPSSPALPSDADANAESSNAAETQEEAEADVAEADGSAADDAVPEGGAEESPADSRDLPGADGAVDKETLRRIMSVIEEYFQNNLLDEVLILFKELVHPNGMAEVLKVLHSCFKVSVFSQMHRRSSFLYWRRRTSSGRRCPLCWLRCIRVSSSQHKQRVKGWHCF